MNADQAERVQMRREHLEREWTWGPLYEHVRAAHTTLVDGVLVPIRGKDIPALLPEAERFHAGLHDHGDGALDEVEP